MEKLAYQIAELLEEYGSQTDISIYFDGKRLSYSKGWVLEEGFNPLDYFEYANPDTLSMTFEGTFYEVMNYGLYPTLHEQFYKLIQDQGYYYEMGHAWNLALYK